MAKPLLVQSDRTLLLEVQNERYQEARDFLLGFAELKKSPDYIHTYHISPLSLFNAAAVHITADEILNGLADLARFPIPPNVDAEIRHFMARYGLVKLVRIEKAYILQAPDEVLDEVAAHTKMKLAIKNRSITGLEIHPIRRGYVKQVLLTIGYPVEDLAGYLPGATLAIHLRTETLSGRPFRIRPYQQEAADRFYQNGDVHGGNGVIVLPCGAGKTIIGILAMSLIGAKTLILTSNVSSVHQWMSEIYEKTNLTDTEVGEYTGKTKQIAPVTVSTYQILTHRKSKEDIYHHFEKLTQEDWGLIIYDEVHLLPAEVFRMTADIQARRRIGLTATLVREDGREEEVFSLIGPKRFDLPWKTLEKQGYIADVTCHEVRIPFQPDHYALYVQSSARERNRIAQENPEKQKILPDLLQKHPDAPILIIGQYLDQLKKVAKWLNCPLITGKTANDERDLLYQAFREGEIPILCVSKVANFAIDLPDAEVAIQISGTFGSRQEEAQRLGRILRPKQNGASAHFYSLITPQTKDQLFAQKRQRFLTEQGYQYEIIDADEIGVCGVELQRRD